MDKIFLKIRNFKELILIVIILAALIIPAFFSGGNNSQIKEIIQALLVIAGLIGFFYSGCGHNRLNNKIFFLLAAWLLALFLSSRLSLSIYQSMSYWLELFCSGLIFYVIATAKFPEQKVELMVKIFLGSSVILSFIGLYFYLTGNYVRLTSTFYWPNPFAGYLLFALPLTLHFLLKEKNIVWLLALVVLLAAFILTGSRGALISLVVVLAVYSIFFRKKIIENRYWLMAALLISLGVVLIFSFAKPANFLDRSKLSETSALDASSSIKLDYWQASLKIFKDNFLLGTGPATFQTVYPLYQDNPVSSGKYPHNWLLEFLAEDGIIAAALFTVFIFFVLFNAIKNDRNNSFKMALFGGILGSTIHNLVDIDWHFRANFIVFWIFAGFLINSSKNNSEIKSEERASGVVRIFFIIFLLALLLRSAVVVRSNYYYGKGQAAQSQNDFKAAASDYQKSLFLNPNPDYSRKYWIILFTMGANAENVQVKKSYLEQAEAVSKKLNKFDRNNSLNYELAGKIFSVEGKLTEAEANFKQAIRLDRFNYPRFYGELAALLIGSGRSEEAKSLLLSILTSFPANVIENRKIIIMNNQKFTSGIANDISYWYYLLGLISLKENNAKEARQYFSLALNLNPENKQAKDLLNSLK